MASLLCAACVVGRGVTMNGGQRSLHEANISRGAYNSCTDNLTVIPALDFYCTEYNSVMLLWATVSNRLIDSEQAGRCDIFGDVGFLSSHN